jgi:hypothetical protein
MFQENWIKASVFCEIKRVNGLILNLAQTQHPNYH